MTSKTLASFEFSALCAMADALPLAVLIVDAEGTIAHANQAAAELLRRPVDALAGMHRTALADPADGRHRLATLERERTGNTQALLRMRTGDGGTIEVELRAAAVVTPDGRSLVWATLLDADVELQVRFVEERLRLALDQLDEGFFLLDAKRDERGEATDFVVSATNASALMLIGRRDASSVVGQSLATAAPWFREAGLLPRMLTVLATKAPSIEEVEVIDRSGVARWLLCRTVAVGERLVVTLADVTARRRADEMIAAREAEMRALADATTEALVLHDRGTIIATNRAAREMFRWPTEDGGVGRSLVEFVAPEARAAVISFMRAQSSDPIDSVALRFDGTQFPVRAYARSVRFLDRQVRVVALRDVSEQRQLEARLALSDRLASIGTLAAGVGHEINNPLSFILLCLDEVRAALVAREAITEEVRARLLSELADARDGALRVRDIVRDLKAFSRASPESRAPVDLAAVIDRAARLAGAELRARARVRVELGALPPVLGDETRLGQVFLNLLMNAAEAIDLGAPDRNEVVVRAERGDGEVTLSVTDTGAGIAPDLLPRLFDPFFSTKVRGNGLGLAISLEIVNAHGGRIEVESTLGKGSTFRVTLPLAVEPTRAPPIAPPAATRADDPSEDRSRAASLATSSGQADEAERETPFESGARWVVAASAPMPPLSRDAAPAPLAPPPAPPSSPQADAGDRAASVRPSTARPRVLLVDDEPVLLRAAARSLGPGHEVLTAGSGRSALAFLEAAERGEHGGPIDAIICDLEMSDGNGMELFHALRERLPRLASRIAFLTGGAFTPRAAEFLRTCGRPRIDKPFTRQSLVEAVVALIGERAAAAPPH